MWNGTKSDYFNILNGTRQGSVLSPTLFSVYIDDLLQELRRAVMLVVYGLEQLDMPTT